MNQRLRIFVNFMRITTTEFSKEIGCGRPAASAILHGSRGISRVMLDRIKYHYPQLNLHWLETGEGNMLETDSTSKVSSDNVNSNVVTAYGSTVSINNNKPKEIVEELQAEIIRLNNTIADNNKEIAELKGRVTALTEIIKMLTGKES
jgi:plasmid maintenance system antidote protein VapI